MGRGKSLVLFSCLSVTDDRHSVFEPYRASNIPDEQYEGGELFPELAAFVVKSFRIPSRL